ncbi:ABC transporter substrate-binding protein [Limoniibacter endophyticus]|uniref:Probable sugar-binding periplasmic protein n=1 Tax=Limoniibacter endophyticus TaxID=1565040 RepID=A0A8J3GGS8_9HYPH|nr:ABC transporter substrate-binding protein [Limoniibacter endophyticus]GHC70602.1 sugar ABC transporter substrate-binding protein [Limoniibacter endophyticus]
MKNRSRAVLAAGAAAIALSLGAAKAAEEVTVLHWWTAGGEAAALNVLKENLGKEGVAWKDYPVAGGSGVQAMTTLRANVTAGNVPTAVQMLGYDITEWAQAGVVANVDDVAKAGKWGDVIPTALQNFGKYEDHWIAAPVNVHSTNWVWINKKALDDAGGKAPETWEELIALLDKMKENGITPIANGGEPWQDATLFEAVVLGIDKELYKKTLNEPFDDEALRSDQMKEAFARMEKLHEYIGDAAAAREWNLASADVIEGRAGLQFMGDWAKGEFLRANQKPGEDFVCIRFPGTEGSVTFNADQFVMFEVSGEEQKAAQKKMAAAVMDPSFQIAFNKVKGSVPARTDVEDTEFDDCGKKGMADLKEANSGGTLLGSMAHGYGGPPAVKAAVLEIVNQHFNGQISTDDAPAALADAIAAAK